MFYLNSNTDAEEDSRSIKGYIGEYDDCGYRIYFPEKHCVVVCRDIKFRATDNDD